MNKHIVRHWWKYVFGVVIVLLGYHYSAPLINVTNNNNSLDTNTDNNIIMEEYTTTASGLQYKVITQGEGGEKPVDTSQVEVHYHGTLPDGTVFDSSRERGETITFGLRQVIPGWTEGLQLMSVGDVYEFYIPAVLAYGDQSPSPLIPAGSDLVFQVELFNIINN